MVKPFGMYIGQSGLGDNVTAGLRRFNSARRVPLLLCDAKGTAIPLSISWITPAELIAAACLFYSNRFLKYSAICTGDIFFAIYSEKKLLSRY